MALPACLEGCSPGLLKMNKDEVFRVIDTSIALAAWMWPEELEARHDKIVNGLLKQARSGVHVKAATSSDHGENPTHDYEKIEEKIKLITPVTLKEAHKKTVIRLRIPNVVRQTIGMIENSTHEHEKLKERIEAVTLITTTKERVPKAVGSVIGKGKSNRPSGDVKSNEYSCGMKQERPKNGDFSEEKLESLSTRLRKRYREFQDSRKRSCVFPFHEAPKSGIRI